MINIKSEREISLMRVACNITYLAIEEVHKNIRPGITTNELDKIAHDFIISKGCTPTFLNYSGFPKSICISVNDEVVHGIPDNRKLKKGDIVSIDCGATYKGYTGDAARTFPVGEISKEKQYLIEHTEKSFYEGVSKIKAGVRLGDVCHAIGSYADSCGLGIVRELVGHGVGAKLHEDPEIPNYGDENTGVVLKEGMTLAIEPMLNLGGDDVCELDNGWTIVTEDYSPSAHYENTILVTKDGYEILTRGDDDGK